MAEIKDNPAARQSFQGQDGPAHAAILSAGIGCALLGAATVLAEAIPSVKEMLTWWAPAGPLSGKTGVALSAWLVSWFALHFLWRERELPGFRGLFFSALLLIFLGWLGTFPPLFEAFTAH